MSERGGKRTCCRYHRSSANTFMGKVLLATTPVEPFALAIAWTTHPAAFDWSAVRVWELKELGDEIGGAVADALEAKGRPNFCIDWAGVRLTLYWDDLSSNLVELISFGRWLAWPRGDCEFNIFEQGFVVEFTAVLNGDQVEIDAAWLEAYRVPVESLAPRVTVGRDVAMRQVGELLGQIEQLLLADHKVYAPLSFVCRFLPTHPAMAGTEARDVTRPR